MATDEYSSPDPTPPLSSMKKSSEDERYEYVKKTQSESDDEHPVGNWTQNFDVPQVVSSITEVDDANNTEEQQCIKISKAASLVVQVCGWIIFLSRSC